MRHSFNALALAAVCIAALAGCKKAAASLWFPGMERRVGSYRRRYGTCVEAALAFTGATRICNRFRGVTRKSLQ